MTSDLTVPQQLRQRLRKYFLVVFGMIGGLFALLVLLGVTLKLADADQKTTGTVLGIVAPLGMLAVVASSWVAVSKLWRCPKCEHGLYWVVSWNMSIFAGMSSPNCPGCGVLLFEPERKKRFVRFLIIAVVLVATAALAASVFFAGARTRRPAPVPADVRPPG